MLWAKALSTSLSWPGFGRGLAALVTLTLYSRTSQPEGEAASLTWTRTESLHLPSGKPDLCRGIVGIQT